MREKDDFVKMKCFRGINNKRGAGAGRVCENKFLRDMVDRLAVGPELVRLSFFTSCLTVLLTDWLQVTRTGLSKVRAGRKVEIKQEISGSVIQALSEANRELSDREHDHILEEEVIR